MPDSPITVTRCQPNIGAEIDGVDLSRPLPPATAAAIRAALNEHQVIVFRDQPLTREQHLAFARVFVTNRRTPFHVNGYQAQPIPGFPEILNVFADGKTKTAADIWHTDGAFHRIPFAVSLLHAKQLPSLGGDTVFSSCVAAYAGLPQDVKRQIRDLKAPHGQVFLYRRRSNYAFADPQKTQRSQDAHPPVAHPVVRIHPETGRPVLFVNAAFTGPILGLPEGEGERLLDYLCDEVKKPDYQMRLRWTPHTLVVWDNRSVQHYAVGDYDEPRMMERVTVMGDAPPIGFADLEPAAIGA